jgi:rare lipoprotein A (peptidoglycan hydrolase)
MAAPRPSRNEFAPPNGGLRARNSAEFAYLLDATKPPRASPTLRSVPARKPVLPAKKTRVQSRLDLVLSLAAGCALGLGVWHQTYAALQLTAVRHGVPPPFAEIGIASWYGEPYHGRQTANGELYDMNLLTAAHRTLPLPTYVRVTNLENERSVVLRVNDRGPFIDGRIIDVSFEAAQLLGFVRQGLVKVRLDAAAPPP